jgi:hypothetical protein
MAKRPIASSSARRPANNDPNTEEAFRVHDARMDEIEALISTGVTQPQYDDTYVKNLISNLRRDLEEHNHRRIQATTAGDTYDGQFKVTQTDGEDLQVTIGVGRFIYGTGSNEIAEATENISASTDTYYLYLEASYSGGLVTAIESLSTYPTQSTMHERFVLAEIDVADSAISEIRQIQYNEIHSARIWD